MQNMDIGQEHGTPGRPPPPEPKPGPEPLIPASEPLTPPSEPLTPPPEPPPPAPEPLMATTQSLAEAEARLAQLQDAYLRARAETENLRRRAQEDVARAHKFAVEQFAEALLPVKDSLEAALAVEAASLASLREGAQMTLRQLEAAFARNRLEAIEPQPGERLDPARHHAISMVAADAGEANTVVGVLQKGYTIAGRLLRPALVTVAQG